MSEVNQARYGLVRVHVIGNLVDNPDQKSVDNVTVLLVRTRDHRFEEVVDNFTLALIEGEEDVELDHAQEEVKTFEIPWERYV